MNRCTIFGFLNLPQFPKEIPFCKVGNKMQEKALYLQQGYTLILRSFGACFNKSSLTCETHARN